MKIYVRERQKVGSGVKSPRYRILAVTGGELRIVATHFRKMELEIIAQEVGAEIVWLEHVPDSQKKKD